jgi:hypothetical protein
VEIEGFGARLGLKAGVGEVRWGCIVPLRSGWCRVLDKMTCNLHKKGLKKGREIISQYTKWINNNKIGA